MPIYFSCPQCSFRIGVPRRFGGKRGQCPECKDIVRIPESKTLKGGSPESQQLPAVRLTASSEQELVNTLAPDAGGKREMTQAEIEEERERLAFERAKLEYDRKQLESGSRPESKTRRRAGPERQREKASQRLRQRRRSVVPVFLGLGLLVSVVVAGWLYARPLRVEVGGKRGLADAVVESFQDPLIGRWVCVHGDYPGRIMIFRERVVELVGVGLFEWSRIDDDHVRVRDEVFAVGIKSDVLGWGNVGVSVWKRWREGAPKPTPN